MNKIICKYHKAKGTHKKVMCNLCTYQSRCADYQDKRSAEIREEEQKSTRHDLTREFVAIEKEGRE